MQKVYLLLRSNQQTGPHTLEELLKLDLKPFDLVWVEGKSYGWSYPSEIETLKPFVTPNSDKVLEVASPAITPDSFEADKTAGKKIFVSMPVANVAASIPSVSVDAIEQKAEELRRRAQSYTPQNTLQPEELRTNYARNLSDVEEDYTSWVFKKKTKSKAYGNKKYWAFGAAIAILFCGTWMVIKMTASKSSAAIQPLVVQTNADEKVANSSIEPTEASAAIPVSQNKLVKRLAASNVSKKGKVQKAAANNLIIKEKAIVVDADVVQKQPAGTIEEQTPIITEEKNEPVGKTKEKRTLKTLFNTLFKKNKKEEAVQEEEPKSASNNNNQRTATHRGDEQESVANIVDLSDQVTVKLNKTSNDWMMGVQGLKLTLYNNSEATLKTAVVQVLYYSDENNLLETKTINFSNIAPGKSQAMAAPDHRLADHVDYKITSARGIANAYAKQ
ncbi:MAG: hypothetical protein ACTHOF_04345 [Flavisolibacter sp.]